MKAAGSFHLGFMHIFKLLTGGFIIAIKAGSFLNLTAIKEYGFIGQELAHGSGLVQMFIRWLLMKQVENGLTFA